MRGDNRRSLTLARFFLDSTAGSATEFRSLLADPPPIGSTARIELKEGPLPLWSLSLLLLFPSPAQTAIAASSDEPSILVRALNPLDEVAVVQTSTGDLEIVRVGDVIEVFSAKVTKVLGDRLVLERVPGPSSDLATIWIYKAARGESSSKSSRVVVFAREAPARDVATPAPLVEAQGSPAPAGAEDNDVKAEVAGNGSDRTRNKKKH